MYSAYHDSNHLTINKSPRTSFVVAPQAFKLTQICTVRDSLGATFHTLSFSSLFSFPLRRQEVYHQKKNRIKIAPMVRVHQTHRRGAGANRLTIAFSRLLGTFLDLIIVLHPRNWLLKCMDERIQWSEIHCWLAASFGALRWYALFGTIESL